MGKDEGKGKEKSRRDSKSFVSRLTLGQVGRLLRIMLFLDLLAVVLGGCLFFLSLEQTVTGLAGLSPAAASVYTARMPDLSVEAVPESLEGFQLGGRVAGKIGLSAEAKRAFSWRAAPDDPFAFGWKVRPLYIVSLPGESGFLQMTFDLGTSLRRFLYTGLLVLLLEFILLLSHTISTRRAVRRVLAPISQLAETARSINTDMAKGPVFKHERYERSRDSEKKTSEKREKNAETLEFSGTIETLNQITATRLDTRIPTENEREELRGLAEAINGMLDRLAAAYSSQMRFVSDASHELRTPLAVLQGYANMLDRWGKDDPAVLQESIEAIKAEANGMQVLVEQLLFLARSDNNTIAMQIQPLDISALAAEVLRETQMVDGLHELISDIEPALWVEGDSGLLKQALRIFVDNAVKYSPQGESLKISTKREEDCVRISVTDSGIGIPSGELASVVERFYRSDESRARATGGTGLGLSIAKWIVQRHGGTLEIVSRENIGTRVSMVLPSCAAAGEKGEGESGETA